MYLDKIMSEFDTEPFQDFRPLAIAAEKGRLDVVSMILSHPSMHGGNEAAVVAAVKGKHVDMLELMFSAGLFVGRGAMLAAVATGDETIMRLITERANCAVNTAQTEDCTVM